MTTQQQRELIRLTAMEASAAIRDGRMTSQELVDACLARIDEVEEDVKAWAKERNIEYQGMEQEKDMWVIHIRK